MTKNDKKRLTCVKQLIDHRFLNLSLEP